MTPGASGRSGAPGVYGHRRGLGFPSAIQGQPSVLEERCARAAPMSSLSSDKASCGNPACFYTHAVCVGRTIRETQVETCARTQERGGMHG
jgi:hypothetical protein